MVAAAERPDESAVRRGLGAAPAQAQAKLLALNWPFLLLITAITLIGVAALYSVAGGSLEPWASRHVVRYCLGLALLFIVALSDIRWWLRAAYPLYVVVVADARGGAPRSASRAAAPSAGWATASSASSRRR